ncbi:hypothetical protein AABB24_003474, partial [Solanum stoloniferum]
MCNHMEKAYSFFVSLLLLHLYLLETCISKNIVINTDQSSLLALKASFTLSSSHTLTQNWSSQASVCDWIGVTCGSRHHRVIALNISNMNIFGKNIPPHLGNLSFLVSLDLSKNYLHGDIPQDLSRLNRLKVMDLSYNNFSGEIPMWFGFNSGFISKLETLSVRNNLLQGSIPKEIGNLENLKDLILFENQLTGSIPLSIFNISTLELLGLSGNQLTGSLPVDICRRLGRIK